MGTATLVAASFLLGWSDPNFPAMRLDLWKWKNEMKACSFPRENLNKSTAVNRIVYARMKVSSTNIGSWPESTKHQKGLFTNVYIQASASASIPLFHSCSKTPIQVQQHSEVQAICAAKSHKSKNRVVSFLQTTVQSWIWLHSIAMFLNCQVQNLSVFETRWAYVAKIYII